MKKVEQLSSHLYLIDDYDLQHDERTGTYVLLGDDITLIETCAAPSLPYILDGLQQLHINLNDVKNIIVTHVHLDHAGAAGLMMEKCPNATLFVHPRGARHMIDPTKLILGAKAVYKEDFDKLFDPILPIEEERVHIVQNGDTIGIYYRELADLDVELYLPSTSPSQFQPDAMIASKNHIQSMNVDTIYFGHYGASSNVTEVYNQLEHWLPIFVNTGNEIFQKHTDFDEATKALQSLLLEKVSTHLTKLNVPSNHSVYNILHLDLEISAMGIIDYLTKQTKSTIN